MTDEIDSLFVNWQEIKAHDTAPGVEINLRSDVSRYVLSEYMLSSSKICVLTPPVCYIATTEKDNTQKDTWKEYKYKTINVTVMTDFDIDLEIYAVLNSYFTNILVYLNVLK